jgi:hypothetical protein
LNILRIEAKSSSNFRRSSLNFSRSLRRYFPTQHVSKPQLRIDPQKKYGKIESDKKGLEGKKLSLKNKRELCIEALQNCTVDKTTFETLVPFQ